MIGRFFDYLMRRRLPLRPDGNRDWDGDADWARLEQEPLRARALIHWGLLAIAGLVVWAAFAEIDEVTRGEGRVIPSSQIQVIQSVDGGIVTEILVREGETVVPGQVLLRVDPTRFLASLGENRAQSLVLQARAERLMALSEGRPFVPSAELLAEIPETVERERTLYYSSRDALAANIDMARQQLEQRQQELNEAHSRRDQVDRSLELASRELTVSKPLAASGAVSEVDLLRLEREVVRLTGEKGEGAARIERLQSAIREARQKIQEVELHFRNQFRSELSEVMGRLAALAEESAALADRVKHAEVKSPVRGTVKRLLVTTVGGVVQPGREVVEVVPLDDALLLEAQIKPKDIAFLRPGQEAMVKFTAYDFAIYGGLNALVEHIGADTVIDERGNAFYMIRVRTVESDLGDNLPIIPGMVAQVDIMTGKKTILMYLLKPVLRAKANAMRER
ncbi:HlyD family type I secretion periplasmic adaptor subunit [Desulfurivibrio sp. C05AmB]|jgi:membrane fusion protein, adhesin transport system|uniref:HlyD family type I secretion periplasmic adaptor subunit n=1 Tax=Desulfurivibrio sp. C05AmB TaxID=3374371 RepID=UPI00376F1F03